MKELITNEINLVYGGIHCYCLDGGGRQHYVGNFASISQCQSYCWTHYRGPYGSSAYYWTE